MTIHDLFANWQAAAQRALAAHLSSENSTQDELLQAAGLDVQTGIQAGGPYMPKMTLYQGCK